MNTTLTTIADLQRELDSDLTTDVRRKVIKAMIYAITEVQLGLDVRGLSPDHPRTAHRNDQHPDRGEGRSGDNAPLGWLDGFDLELGHPRPDDPR